MRSAQFARAPARRPRPRPAFIESVLPGLLGGVTSTILGYPLELAETTLQLRPAQAAPSPALAPARTRRVRPPPPPAPTRAPTPVRVLADLWAADGAAGVLRGADMALLSALFGFGAFFGTTAALGAVVPADAGLAGAVATNVLAAVVAQVVNSPFQLLKTTAVSGGYSGSEAFHAAIGGGRGLRGLWAGLGGNMLGVVLVAAQFTLFQVLAAEVAVGGAPLAPATAGVVGAAACAGAAALTYPTVVIKTRVLAAAEGARKCVLLDVGRELWDCGGLYAGVGTFLARSIPPTGVLFAVQSFLEQGAM